MLPIDEIVFSLALASGGLLVLGASLGVLEMAGHLDSHAHADGHSDGQLHGADHEHHAHSPVLAALSFGRIPFLILLMLLTLSFGGVGMTLAPTLHALLGSTWGALVALAVALAASLVFTHSTSRLLARVLPRTKAYSGHKRDLVGLSGRVVSASRHGQLVARVLDRGGAEMRVNGRFEGESVRTGDEVALLDYEAEHDRFLMEKISAR